MDKSIPRLVGNSRLRTLLVGLIGSALILGSQVAAIPSFATESRSLARVDIVVGDGGVIDPDDTNTFSVVVRADETGALNAGDITVSLTETPFTSEDQIRRFLAGEGSPAAATIGFIRSPDVPQLESREIPFLLGADLWPSRLAALEEGEDEPRVQAGIFGLETTYVNRSNLSPALRQLSGRQVIVVLPNDTRFTPAAIAPIVTLTTSATGGIALRPEELQALTIPGGPLDVVTSAVASYPATIAIDSRITSSITALGNQAPAEALTWASTLGSIGLAQFALPWADADPLGSLEIDTLVYARLGEYPWLHGNVISTEELATLQTRSASAVLLSSNSLPSDRAVVSVGDTRVIRVDDQLSQLTKDALQAPTALEAEADLQRAQGVIAYRALSGNREILVFSVGRLPATAIAPRIESVLARFASMPVATAVPVPLEVPASETLATVPRVPSSPESQAFRREIKELWEGDVTFATIASDPEGAVAGRWTRYQSLLSSTWLTDPNGLAAEWVRAQQDSRDFRNSVRVEQGSAITVLSDETSLPVTVVNDLPSDVVVTLQVRPTTAILAIEKPLTSISIGANGSNRVFIPVQSLANGTVSVEFSLLTPGGEQLGDVVVVPVTIRAGWEGVISVVLAVIVGGTFAFGIVRAIQRRRLERLAGEEES